MPTTSSVWSKTIISWRCIYFNILRHFKISPIIWSQHAIYEAFNGNKITLLYFDAHPDFVSSTRNYYGSVITDSSDYINFAKSILIGTRAAEQEELDNASKQKLETITPMNILESGINTIVKRIISKCASTKVYLSVDLDCMDPGVAPGVSVPAPGGLFPLDLMYIIKRVSENLQIVGMDIVELSPDYDLNQNTANHAARLLMETIASLKIRQKKQH